MNAHNSDHLKRAEPEFRNSGRGDDPVNRPGWGSEIRHLMRMLGVVLCVVCISVRELNVFSSIFDRFDNADIKQ